MKLRNLMSHWRKVLVFAGIALSLSIGSSAWAAPSIQFSDMTDGTPLVIASSGIDMLSSSTSVPEGASVDALLHIPFGQGVLNSGNSSLVGAFVLYEPESTTVSDYVLISTPQGPGFPGQDYWVQFVHFEFRSDVDGQSLQLPPFDYSFTMSETGLMQTQSFYSQTGDNIFDVGIQSDVSNVPEPATMLLLGLGLVGMAGVRRKIKK